MSDKHENLPPPPSYEQATQRQPPVDLGNKNAPYPQHQFMPSQQVPQQPYPGCPSQYLTSTGNPIPGACWIQGPYTGHQVSRYGPNYPMSTQGYNMYSSVSPSGTVTYTGATFVVTTPGQNLVNKRKQIVLCFMVGVIMLVLFIIIISSIMG